MDLPPMRAGAGRSMRRFSVEFDQEAARRLPGAEHLIAFNGSSLAQLGAARRAGFRSLTLVSATAHMRRVERQHALALRRHPLEGSWAKGMLERSLAEYAESDRILVSSRRVRDSFLEEGFADELLIDFPLTPDRRFEPGPRADSSTFDIVYVGSLSVVKGVPLLIDAVRALPFDDLRLMLLGGWSSRGMRRFIQAACAADLRIRVGLGDPLPHLRQARLCAHPSYDDGFGYGPTEALACGVPVIASQDTGMNELIDPGRTGLVVGTGDQDALAAAIESAYRGELRGG